MRSQDTQQVGAGEKGYPWLKAMGSLLHVMHQSLLPAPTELLGATPHAHPRPLLCHRNKSQIVLGLHVFLKML